MFQQEESKDAKSQKAEKGKAEKMKAEQKKQSSGMSFVFCYVFSFPRPTSTFYDSTKFSMVIETNFWEQIKLLNT